MELQGSAKERFFFFFNPKTWPQDKLAIISVILEYKMDQKDD